MDQAQDGRRDISCFCTLPVCWRTCTERMASTHRNITTICTSLTLSGAIGRTLSYSNSDGRGGGCGGGGGCSNRHLGFWQFNPNLHSLLGTWAFDAIVVMWESQDVSGSNLYFIRRWVPESAVWFLTTCTTSTKFIWHLKMCWFVHTHLFNWHLEIYCIYSHNRI